jgi:hypothetical protein
MNAHTHSFTPAVALPDIATQNTQAVLRAALRHKLPTLSGPWCCYGCDASRLFEVDDCPDCGERTSAYPAPEVF